MISFNDQSEYFKYLTFSKMDEAWGLYCTTTGYQNIKPNSKYPLSNHPSTHCFCSRKRTLEEYQLLYIIAGSGYFQSQSVPLTEVKTGTIIMLFPGEWHSYYPSKDSGWKELWVGFKGWQADNILKGNFFSKKEPILTIGISATIINQYLEIFKISELQKVGHMQAISGITMNILGNIYYKNLNSELHQNSFIYNKINSACVFIKENIEKKLSPKDIADSLHLGYTWFRRMFKIHTGMSPIQYITEQRLAKSKELLANTDLSISEIAYKLSFENVSQFSNLFKSKENITASDFRNQNNCLYFRLLEFQSSINQSIQKTKRHPVKVHKVVHRTESTRPLSVGLRTRAGQTTAP